MPRPPISTGPRPSRTDYRIGCRVHAERLEISPAGSRKPSGRGSIHAKTSVVARVSRSFCSLPCLAESPCRLRRHGDDLRGQVRRRCRRLAAQRDDRGERRALHLQASARRHAIQSECHLHREGCRYLFRDGVAERRARDARCGAAVLGRGQPHLFPVRHPQQRQVLDRAQTGRQMARHHRRQCRLRARSRRSPAPPTCCASRPTATA